MTRHSHTSDAALADLAPNDKVGTPDSEIEHCETHDVLYRVGGACLVCEREAE